MAESTAQSVRPRRALQPLDITLRHGKRYQRARVAFLTFSVSLTFVLPLWHLRAAVMDGAGPPLTSPAVGLARLLPAPPAWWGAPTSLRLWAVELIDPALALGVGLTRGFSFSWLWAALPGLLLVATLGRFFCGWACPYLPILAASNAARWFLGRFGVPTADLKVPRRTAFVVLVGALFATAFTGAQVVPLLYPPALLGRAGFGFVFFGALSAGLALVVGAFVFDTFVSRAGFCRALCPGGAAFSVVGALSPLRVVREVPKCTDCTVCDVVCNLGQRPMTDKLDGGCERCGKCIASCPTQALSLRLAKPSALRGALEKP